MSPLLSSPRETSSYWAFHSTNRQPSENPTSMHPGLLPRESWKTNTGNAGSRHHNRKKEFLGGPAMFVPKKLGEIFICIDYCGLIKKTIRKSLSISLSRRSTGSVVWEHTFLYLRLAVWLLAATFSFRWPRENCILHRPRNGTLQFARMPIGLCGAASLFQRPMDQVIRGLSFVTTYQDDILIHSKDEQSHRCHLQEVFEFLTQAGLTIRGIKCYKDMLKESYMCNIWPFPLSTRPHLDWHMAVSSVHSPTLRLTYSQQCFNWIDTGLKDHIKKNNNNFVQLNTSSNTP